MKLVVANWKMNPETEKEAVRLAKKEDLEGVVLMPPLSFLAPVGDILKRAELGSQDVFYGKEGAFTGEVSATQLNSLGVKYVLVGHSERRDPPLGGGDTDEIVAKKFKAALEGGLTPILCVGEKERKLKVKSLKLKEEKNFVVRQLKNALSGVNGQMSNVVVAYEPVWAISSKSGNVSDTPESAGEMIRYIREFLTTFFEVRPPKEVEPLVLYGGSVNGKNAEGFLRLPEVDGVLVGAASLRPEEFKTIVEVARK